MPVIRFSHNRTQIIVPIAILPPTLDSDPHRVERLDALLDTGASASGIPIAVAKRLGLPKRGKEIITTAGGEVPVRLFQFRIGIYLDQDSTAPLVIDREFIGIESHPGQAFQALLGMDVIGVSELHLSRNGSGSLSFA